MIDVAWMGRATARNPITVKSARRIERDAKGRGWIDAAIILFVVAVLSAAWAGWIG